MVPTIWSITMELYIFNQNKKVIQINNNKESRRRGAKLPDSTINCGKSYPLVHIGERIFKTTHMAIYVGNQNK